jgi:pimeloyl-[acyl-carrier protein] methyl ester esterase
MSGSLAVESVGAGPPLVLLHGWAMHSGIWGAVIPRLARRFRVHAVDLPGHGKSPLAAPFTLDGTVSAVASALADESATLTVVGWSLGGLVAVRWAQGQPERISRLALVATSPRFVAGIGWPHGMAEETLARFGDELGVAWKHTIKRFLTLQMQGSEHGRAMLAQLRHELFARGEPSHAALRGALETLVATDLRAGVGSVRQPSLVVSGGRDTLAVPAAGRWLAEHLPVARFALIPGAAHVPFLSHRDAFDAAMDPFLDDR